MIGKISVVVPALITSEKQVLMTQKCIKQARMFTEIPYELIIVETASQHLIDEADIYIYEKRVTNATRSINRGFSCASGDFVVLLTNDVFVSDKWLEALCQCFTQKEDCGLATLATTQFGHQKHNEISEGIWFSVAMIPHSLAMFDENYVNSWDDSDLIMRSYISGKKMYRNYNCVVEHLVGNTQYSKKDHQDNFDKNKKYFTNKFKEHNNNRMYKILTEGHVL